MPPMCDTHAHLDDERFSDDLPAVLDRAAPAVLTHVVCVATTAADSTRCVQSAHQYPLEWASAAVQPDHGAGARRVDRDEIVRRAGAPRVVALGETGLARHWDFTPFPQQEDYFARHLDLSRRLGLPVIIHCREAEADV